MAEPQWPLKRLKEITSKIGSGATPRGGKNSYLSSGISLIRSLNVYDFKFVKDDLAFISEGQAAELSNVIVQPDDILLNITGASVARCCLTDPQYLPARVNQHVAIVRVKPEVANARFVLYCINSVHFKSRLLALAQGGATREALTKTTIEDFKVLQPPLPIQRRIAGILSAYDELIENSQRRIKILEAMARALYREWFVHFRFPGHESIPRVPSPLGDIPQGWAVRTLAELCSRMESGGTPKRGNSEYWEGGEIDWYKTGELWDGFLFGSQEKITALGQRQSTARLFDPGTILMAIYGSPTVGRMGILTNHASCNQAALGLVASADLISQTYLYFVLFSLREHFNSLAQGAAQQNISKEKVANAIACVPPRRILESFDIIAEPIFSQIRTIQRQTQNLRRTRDLLLPRLLSGQINVEVD
jgi:type I restriction enzyme S subunit